MLFLIVIATLITVIISILVIKRFVVRIAYLVRTMTQVATSFTTLLMTGAFKEARMLLAREALHRYSEGDLKALALLPQGKLGSRQQLEVEPENIELCLQGITLAKRFLRFRQISGFVDLRVRMGDGVQDISVRVSLTYRDWQWEITGVKVLESRFIRSREGDKWLTIISRVRKKTDPEAMESPSCGRVSVLVNGRRYFAC